MASQESSSMMSTITENRDRSQYTSITKDYFVTGDQHINTIAKNRDGDIWVELRRAVSETIDQDLKAMMILRLQEVGLKVITDDDEKTVSSWNEIGKAWRSSDSIDTSKKKYEIVHATFDDNSSYEIYMEGKIMEQLELQYSNDDTYD